MWWLWPHLRRLWAAAGTVSAGLAVNYIYGWLRNQPASALSHITDHLWRYRYWSLSALLAFAVVSVFAERQFHKHEAQAPRLLRTQGGPVRTLLSRFKLAARVCATDAQAQSAAPNMVGRATELAQLNHWFEQARRGARRVIFVSGEAGIGKTTLTRAFADSLASDRAIRIGRGQCVDQYGAGEPYLPILEALTRLCREPGGKKLVEILYRIAPAWSAQMPSLVSVEDRARLQGLAQGTTQLRMLREMAEALEVIAAETPVVLYLEDLQWSDPSTLDLIATVARRSEPTRLMILGTYRPVEMLAAKHPLRAMKEELELHRHAIELRLPLLAEADVAAFVAERFSEGEENIAPVVYARTEGNPLFMVNVIEYLADRGSLADAEDVFGLAITRSDLRRALLLAGQVMQDASRTNSPGVLLFAHYALGLARLCRGDLVESRHQFQKALEHQDIKDGHGRYVDWGVGARTWASVNEWLLGCPEQAQRLVQDARALAHRTGKPFNEASAEIDGSVVHILTGDFTRVRDACDEGLRAANSFGIPTASGLGKIYGGFARARLNERGEAVVLIRTGIDEMESLSYRQFRGFYLTLLADAQSIIRDLGDALVTLERAIETNTDELWSRPLTLTLRGELHFRADPDHIDLAERDFREAIELSRKIRAKSAELRATTSLARLLRDTGRRDDARTMLAEVYNWFTEGFDTADLKDAKALLDELES